MKTNLSTSLLIALATIPAMAAASELPFRPGDSVRFHVQAIERGNVNDGFLQGRPEFRIAYAICGEDTVNCVPVSAPSDLTHFGRLETVKDPELKFTLSGSELNDAFQKHVALNEKLLRGTPKVSDAYLTLFLVEADFRMGKLYSYQQIRLDDLALDYNSYVQLEDSGKESVGSLTRWKTELSYCQGHVFTRSYQFQLMKPRHHDTAPTGSYAVVALEFIPTSDVP